LTQIQGVEKRVQELKKLQMTNRNALTALGDPARVNDFETGVREI